MPDDGVLLNVEVPSDGVVIALLGAPASVQPIASTDNDSKIETIKRGLTTADFFSLLNT